VGERFESRAIGLRQRNPWLIGLALLPLLGSIAAVIATVSGFPQVWPLMIHGFWISALLVTTLVRRNPYPFERSVRVRAHGDAIFVDDLRVARTEIREAFVVPKREGFPLVRIDRGPWRLPLDLVVRDVEEGRQILRALGLDASQSVAKVQTASYLVSRRGPLIGSGLAFGAFALAIFPRIAHAFPFAQPFGAVAMALSVVAMLALIAKRTDVSIGADGILIHWLWVRRFVRCEDILTVSEYEDAWGRNRNLGVSLQLKSGEEIRLPVGARGIEEDRCAALVERIRETMLAQRSGQGAAATALLGRQGRAMSEWIRALRAMGVGADATLRIAPTDPQVLLRVVESPSSPAEERAAAAVAIAASGDEEARTRLRVAAEAVAEPKLRVALEAAAEEDEAALEAALGELSEPLEVSS